MNVIFSKDYENNKIIIDIDYDDKYIGITTPNFDDIFSILEIQLGFNGMDDFYIITIRYFHHHNQLIYKDFEYGDRNINELHEIVYTVANEYGASVFGECVTDKYTIVMISGAFENIYNMIRKLRDIEILLKI